MSISEIIDLAGLGGIALSLALGFLIGIQRGWTMRNDPPGSRFAGIRTFGLFGLAGGVAGALFDRSEGIATIVLASTAALVLIGYFRTTQRDGGVSGTTSMVGLLTVACGFLAATGQPFVATAIAVGMIGLLATRTSLHRWLRHLNEAEVAAIARFALIALVVLPLLPDRPYGPYDAWNPRQIWLVVVLVSGFSFAGYIAARMLGPSRGTLATAAAGSMVSSTAVTASLANHMRDESGNLANLNGAIAVASAVMFVRVMVLVILLAPFALATFAMLALPGLAVSLAAAAWLLWHGSKTAAPEAATLDVRNPFDIGPALLLGGLVMVFTLAARWVLARFGDAGLAVVLAVSGTIDVDSAIITMGNLPQGTLDPRVAGVILAVPVVLNTLFKAGALVSIAGWRKARNGAILLVAAALSTSVAAALIALA